VITLSVGDRELTLRVAGEASLFPTVIDRPSQFVVLDYDTLFLVLNADAPGTAVPTEAWFFRDQEAPFAAMLERPPFRLQRAVGARPLEARLLGDPLASGTRIVLLVSGLSAGALGLLGLVLATRSVLASERRLLAEYEALGVAPPTLARASQLRFVVLSVAGIAAALVGGFLTLRLIGAFVAVTGGGTRPLPAIVPTVAWLETMLIVGVVAVLGLAAVSLLARRVLKESPATRLRA
jgi:hypothetical protein